MHMSKLQSGKMTVKFLLWPSVIISVVGTILLTLLLNLIF